MGFVQYILGLIIAASGLLAGVIISHLAKEEIYKGRKYFLWLEDLVLVVFLFFIWYKQLFSPLFFWPITVLILLLLLHPDWTKEKFRWIRHLRNSLIPYFLFALILTTTKNSPSFEIFIALTFLWGIPAGSRAFAEHRWKYIIAYAATLVGIGLLFWFLQ